jgi:ATP-dependent DNA ligase
MTPADLPLCIDLDWSRVQYPCIVEPKIDGFRCYVEVDDDGTVHPYSRNGREWSWLAPALSELSAMPGACFDGELVIGGSWATTNAAVKRQTCESGDVKFYVFTPLLRRPNAAPPRWAELDAPHGLYRLRGESCRDRYAVEAWYHRFVDMGYEGIVVKAADRLGRTAAARPGRSGDWMKLKPQPTDDVFQDGRFVEVDRATGEAVRERLDKEEV